MNPCTITSYTKVSDRKMISYLQELRNSRIPQIYEMAGIDITFLSGGKLIS
jgi:hypothetical protein